jgi:hypothetical protein
LIGSVNLNKCPRSNSEENLEDAASTIASAAESGELDGAVEDLTELRLETARAGRPARVIQDVRIDLPYPRNTLVLSSKGTRAFCTKLFPAELLERRSHEFED